MTEHQEQCALFSLLRRYHRKYPVLRNVFAIPNGGQRHPAVGAKLKAEGVLAGVWDIFTAVPVDGYSGLWIEMKVKPNRLTKSQERFRERVGNGYKWEVCYSWIEAANAIGEYLGIRELEEIE